MIPSFVPQDGRPLKYLSTFSLCCVLLKQKYLQYFVFTFLDDFNIVELNLPILVSSFLGDTFIINCILDNLSISIGYTLLPTARYPTQTVGTLLFLTPKYPWFSSVPHLSIPHPPYTTLTSCIRHRRMSSEVPSITPQSWDTPVTFP